MSYMHQMPLWALPNHQFRYPEFFQQRHQLEHEGNRAWEAYMNGADKPFDGNNHGVPYYDEPHLDHSHCRYISAPDQHTPSELSDTELRTLDALTRLLLEVHALRHDLEDLRDVVEALAAEDCDCDDAEDGASDETDSAMPDELAWLPRGDGEQGQQEDSMEQYRCASCGSDHPTFGAASATSSEGKPPREDKGKGKEVKLEEFVVPTLVHEGVTDIKDEGKERVVSKTESESSGLGSSA